MKYSQRGKERFYDFFVFQIHTPSKLYFEYGYLKMTPFYHQSWFMVALAAGSIIVIIVVVSILCIKSKSYKYKSKHLLS